MKLNINKSLFSSDEFMDKVKVGADCEQFNILHYLTILLKLMYFIFEINQITLRQ